jgi:hypothetical protein
LNVTPGKALRVALAGPQNRTVVPSSVPDGLQTPTAADDPLVAHTTAAIAPPIVAIAILGVIGDLLS